MKAKAKAKGGKVKDLKLPSSTAHGSRIPGNIPGSLARQRKDIAQPYQEQRIDAGIPTTVGPNKGVYVQGFDAGKYGKSGFIGDLELKARRKLGNRGF